MLSFAVVWLSLNVLSVDVRISLLQFINLLSLLPALTANGIVLKYPSSPLVVQSECSLSSGRVIGPKSFKFIG